MANGITPEQAYLCFEKILREHLGENVVLSTDTNLRDEFDIDSLEFVELSIKLEKAFNIKFSNAEVRRCITPADIVQLILRALAVSQVGISL